MQQALSQEMSFLENTYNTVAQFLVNYSFQVLGAILIVIIGILAARYLANLTLRFAEKRGWDITLRTYISHVVRLLVLFSFLVIALGKFGISIAPFVAALGAVTLGIGLALQGVVSNYGAGVSIILTRPFKVGDTISIHQASGLVKEIKLANTVIETEDSEQIVIPNKHIIGEILQNSFAHKMVETHIGISYGDDPELAIKTLRDALRPLDYVADEPVPQIGIDSFGDSAVVIGVRFWVPTDRYFECKYQANLLMYKAVNAAGLHIPFPQLDVHSRNS